MSKPVIVKWLDKNTSLRKTEKGTYIFSKRWEWHWNSHAYHVDEVGKTGNTWVGIFGTIEAANLGVQEWEQEE